MGGCRTRGHGPHLAQDRSEINPAAEVAQTAFEVEAMLLAANALFVMTGEAEKLAHARRGLEHILSRLAPRRKSGAPDPRHFG